MKLNFSLLLLYGLLLMLAHSATHAKPLREGDSQLIARLQRYKRQFSLNFGATHEDGYGTDVNAEAIASLWKSQSGNTKLDGSASYTQHFGGLSGDGKARISGMLTFSHGY
uniref:Attacin C-terminal domain-containing protein n=1 Tax=Anopheles coluzzii TaxID=1518534 RepID=A0A8W7Q5G9_ANOCL